MRSMEVAISEENLSTAVGATAVGAMDSKGVGDMDPKSRVPPPPP